MWCRRQDSNLRSTMQRILSPPPLTTRVHLHHQEGATPLEFNGIGSVSGGESEEWFKERLQNVESGKLRGYG